MHFNPLLLIWTSWLCFIFILHVAKPVRKAKKSRVLRARNATEQRTFNSPAVKPQRTHQCRNIEWPALGREFWYAGEACAAWSSQRDSATLPSCAFTGREGSGGSAGGGRDAKCCRSGCRGGCGTEAAPAHLLCRAHETQTGAIDCRQLEWWRLLFRPCSGEKERKLYAMVCTRVMQRFSGRAVVTGLPFRP
jgi:hypothetical protein